ncbi:MAG: hypothetical protein WCE53_03285 [Candidatus Acidiferrum sp.]
MKERPECWSPAYDSLIGWGARGGRDLKQADYLLDNAIAPNWTAA